MNTSSQNITIFDFSGIYIYESEEFTASGVSPRFISCQDIGGTNCYCDEAAQEEILHRYRTFCCASVDNADAFTVNATEDPLSKADPNTNFTIELPTDTTPSIRLIDSGNYHYMSALLLSQITEPVTLVLFDHHPDTQAPAFGDVLSCGGWVRYALEHQPLLRQVIAIGVDTDLAKEEASDLVDAGLLHFYDVDDCIDKNNPDHFLLPEEPQYPVYLSIDKDVLSTDALLTNWDQGDMTTAQLTGILAHIARSYSIVATDICGEPSPTQEGIDLGSEACRSAQISLALLQALGPLI